MRFMILSALLILVLGPLAGEAEARRGGGFGRGGGRGGVAAATSYRPGRGVGHSATVAAGRYHRPAVPNYRPAVGYPGSAVRTTRRVARRVAYRTAAGYSYYYGATYSALPSSACYPVIWQGMSAYNCNGVMYVYQNSQYYVIEGA